MAGNVTFTMLKPDAVANGYVGSIMKMITDAGFRIVAMKMMRIGESKAAKFYDIHEDKPFFQELLDYMTSGPIIAAVLEKENAIEEFRSLIGATDPKKAAPGTVRNLYAESIAANAIHGSDSDENALREASFYFSGSEMFDANGKCMG